MASPRSLLFGVLCVGAFLGNVPAFGQGGELTGDFGKLSAKERARIAKEEDENAAKDADFQTLMTAAEALFRTKDYEGALAKYEEARTRRPFNVYPKVKIQDLQALIAKRDAEQKVAAVPEPPITAEPPVAPPAPAEPTVVLATDPVPAPVPAPLLADPVYEPVPAKAAAPVEVKREVPVRSRPVAAVPEPTPALEVGERVYKEGRSIVVESSVAEEGRIVVYRKVAHPWGEEHFFREGVAIPDRAYKAALGK